MLEENERPARSSSRSSTLSEVATKELTVSIWASSSRTLPTVTVAPSEPGRGRGRVRHAGVRASGAYDMRDVTSVVYGPAPTEACRSRARSPRSKEEVHGM